MISLVVEKESAGVQLIRHENSLEWEEELRVGKSARGGGVSK